MTIKLFQAAWKSCLSSKPLVVQVRKWAQTSSMQVSTAFHTVQFHLVHICYFQKHYFLAEVKNKVVPIIKYLPSRELCTQTVAPCQHIKQCCCASDSSIDIHKQNPDFEKHRFPTCTYLYILVSLMVLSYLSLCLSTNDMEHIPPLQKTVWIAEHATG